MDNYSSNNSVLPQNMLPLDLQAPGVVAPVISSQGAAQNMPGAIGYVDTPAPTMAPTPASTAFRDVYWTYKDKLERVMPFATASVNKGQQKGDVFFNMPVPSGMVAAAPSNIKEMFGQYHYWRGNLMIVVKCNLTPFNKGCFRLWFLPQGHDLQLNALSVIARTVNEGCYVDTANGRQYMLPIWYMGRQEALETSFMVTQDGISNDIGAVLMTIEAPVDVCQEMPIQVSGYFPGSQFIGPRVDPISLAFDATTTQLVHRVKERSYPWPSKYEYDLLQAWNGSVDPTHPYDSVEHLLPADCDTKPLHTAVKYPGLEAHSIEVIDGIEAHGIFDGIGDLLGGVLGMGTRALTGGGGGGGGSLLDFGSHNINNTTNNNVNVSGGNGLQTNGQNANAAKQDAKGGEGTLSIPPMGEFDKPEYSHMGTAVYGQEWQDTANISGTLTRVVKMHDNAHERRENNADLSGIGVNQMLISYLCSRPTLYESFGNLSWSSTNAIGDIINGNDGYDVTMCPKMNARTVAKASIIEPDLAECVALRFEQWRAEIVYTFLIVSNVKQRGALMAVFVPEWEDTNPAHLVDANNAYAFLINLADGQKSFEIRVPYMDQTVSKFCNRAIVEGLGQTPARGNYIYKTEQRRICTGKFYLWNYQTVYNGSTAEDTTCSVSQCDIIVLRHAENVHLSGRTTRNDYAILSHETVFEDQIETIKDGCAHGPGDIVPFEGTVMPKGPGPVQSGSTFDNAMSTWNAANKIWSQLQTPGSNTQVQPALSTGEPNLMVPTATTVANPVPQEQQNSMPENKPASVGIQDAAQPDTFMNTVRVDIHPGITDTPPLNYSNVFGIAPSMKTITHLGKRFQIIAEGKMHSGTSKSGWDGDTDIPVEELTVPITMGVGGGENGVATGLTTSGSVRTEADYWANFFVGWTGNLLYIFQGHYPDPSTGRDAKHEIRFYQRNLAKLGGVDDDISEKWLLSKAALKYRPNVPTHQAGRGNYAYMSVTPFTRFGWNETLSFNGKRTSATRMPRGMELPVMYQSHSGTVIDNRAVYKAQNYDRDRCMAGVLSIDSNASSMARKLVDATADVATYFTLWRALGDNFTWVRVYDGVRISTASQVGPRTGALPLDTYGAISFPDIGVGIPVAAAPPKTSVPVRVFINGMVLNARKTCPL
jgi:hypothetical protein